MGVTSHQPSSICDKHLNQTNYLTNFECLQLPIARYTHLLITMSLLLEFITYLSIKSLSNLTLVMGEIFKEEQAQYHFF